MTLEILGKYKVKNKREIVDYLEKNEVYLSYSMQISLAELAYEYENSHSETFYEKLKRIKLDIKKSKKERGMELIDITRKIKMPIYHSTFKEFKKRLNVIKNKNINVKYPKELEGKEIILEIKLENKADVSKVLDSLNKNIKNLEEMVGIFENGIWEE